MKKVKREPFQRKGVCGGCLSLDRITSPLEKRALFDMLITQKRTVYQETKSVDIELCWECKATLKKISIFQEKINESQYILENSLHLDDNTFLSSTISTSTLNTIHNPDYDYIFVYDENEKAILHAPLLLDIKEEIETLPENYDNDVDNNDIDDNDIDINDISNNDIHDDFKGEDYSEDDNNVSNVKEECSEREYEHKKRRKTIQRRHATVTNFSIDYEILEKYCAEVVVPNSELLQIFELQDKRKKYTKVKNCSQCTKKYQTALGVKRHANIEHLPPNKPITCAECKEKFNTVSELNDHWLIHNKVFKCIFCSHVFEKKSDVVRHLMNKHSKIYTCNLCGLPNHSSIQFTQHLKNFHTSFKCDDCGRIFHDKKKIEKHMLKSHLPVVCKECNREFPKYRSLEVHCRNFHPELMYKSVKQELSYCVECDRQFPSQYLYKRHLVTAVAHVPKKPVKVPCPECGKVFSRKSYMKNHFKLVHTRASAHYCEICNKQFVSGYSLRTHRKFVHEKSAKPKDKICDICGRGFHTNRTLLNHKRTHTGERPYKCSYCPAAFAQSYARKTHERSQHKNVADVFILPP